MSGRTQQEKCGEHPSGGRHGGAKAKASGDPSATTEVEYTYVKGSRIGGALWRIVGFSPDATGSAYAFHEGVPRKKSGRSVQTFFVLSPHFGGKANVYLYRPEACSQ